MPNTNSAKKRMRQTVKRRLLNRSKASAMKTAIRRVKQAAGSGDPAAVQAAVNLAFKKIDKAAKTHVIHANTAARRKALVASHARGGASASA